LPFGQGAGRNTPERPRGLPDASNLRLRAERYAVAARNSPVTTHLSCRLPPVSLGSSRWWGGLMPWRLSLRPPLERSTASPSTPAIARCQLRSGAPHPCEALCLTRHVQVATVHARKRLAGRVVNAIAAGDCVDGPWWRCLDPMERDREQKRNTPRLEPGPAARAVHIICT
jgi:hypothetical protein